MGSPGLGGCGGACPGASRSGANRPPQFWFNGRSAILSLLFLPATLCRGKSSLSTKEGESRY